MEFIKKEVFIGFATAILATIFGLFLFVTFSGYSWNDAMTMVKEGNLYGKVLSLAALANLFVFFIFIKKHQDARAKGVLLATICLALLLLFTKFF